MRFNMAPVSGLEPEMTESKSVVLPLHHTGSIIKYRIFNERCLFYQTVGVLYTIYELLYTIKHKGPGILSTGP